MASIERNAELCPDQGGLQPCTNCGSTSAIVETFRGNAPRIRRLCCGFGPFHDQRGAGRFAAFLPGMNDLLPAEACLHG